MYQTYDTPGGAHGTLTTNTFSLKGYDAGDKPVVYFNYRASTETDANQMWDGFHVYVSTDGANWKLVASTTNMNDQRGVDNTQGHLGINEVTRQNGGVGLTADSQWRQGRVDLSNYAGQENIRIRFDFSTASDLDIGDLARGGDYLRAVAGNYLRDGNYFYMGGTDAANPNAGVRFEFDMGYSLVFPTAAGNVIPVGRTLTIQGTTFTFVASATSGTNIQVGNGRTAAQIAADTAAMINANLGTSVRAVVDSVHPDRVFLQKATSVSGTALTTDSTNGFLVTLEGSPGLGAASLAFPSGAFLPANNTLTIDGVTFTFTNNASSGTNIQTGGGRTAAQIAADTATAIKTTLNVDSSSVTVNGATLIISNSKFAAVSVSSGSNITINGTAGMTGISAIPIRGDMNATGVAQAIQLAIDRQYAERNLRTSANAIPNPTLSDGTTSSYGGYGVEFIKVLNARQQEPTANYRQEYTDNAGGPVTPLQTNYVPGQTFTLSDQNRTYTFEFTEDNDPANATNGAFANGALMTNSHIAVRVSNHIHTAYDPVTDRTTTVPATWYSAQTIAENVAAAINGVATSTSGSSVAQGALDFKAEAVSALLGSSNGAKDWYVAFHDSNDGTTGGLWNRTVPVYFNPVNTLLSQPFANTASKLSTAKTASNLNVNSTSTAIISPVDGDSSLIHLIGSGHFVSSVLPQVQALPSTAGGPDKPGLAPLGFSSSLQGDAPWFTIGATAAWQNNRAGYYAAGQNNHYEGVYVDDIIIGFAERGEMVHYAGGAGSEAASQTTFVSQSASTRYDSTYSDPRSIIPNGYYQFEIHRGQEYGVYTPNPGGVRTLNLTQTFDTNTRFADAMTIVAPSASNIRHGDTFTIGDGVNKQVFQFLDPAISTSTPDIAVYFTGRETAAEMGQKIVEAINDGATSIKVTASQITTGGLANGLGSNRITLFGATYISGISYDVYGKNLQLDLVDSTVAPTVVQPSYTPDGKRVVFVSNLKDPNNWNVRNPNGYQQIFSMNLDGSDVRQITSNTDAAISYERPSIVAGGAYLLYSENDGTGGNYKLHADLLAGGLPTGSSGIFTTILQTLVSTFVSVIDPYFVYDGTSNQLVFAGINKNTPTKPDYDIYNMNVSTGTPTQLTSSVYDDKYPSYNRSGLQVVFQSSRDGDDEIYMMPNTGENTGVVATQLTFNTSEDTQPSFDTSVNTSVVASEQIAFVSDRDGNREIYSMNGDGSDPSRLTTNYIDDNAPVFNPVLNPTFKSPFYTAMSPLGYHILFASNRDSGTDQYNIVMMGSDGSGATVTSPSVYRSYALDASDQNQVRSQGQIVIDGNRVTYSSQFGISQRADSRDGTGNANSPHPGSPLPLINVNTNRLVPGVTISNNIVAFNATGGIEIAGDTGTSPAGAVPFTRVVNNTIKGTSATGLPTFPMAVVSTNGSGDGNALRDALLGAGITAVGEATLVGNLGGPGLDGTGTDFSQGLWTDGTSQGILLTSGDVQLAKGPKSANITGLASGKGDTDLDSLLPPIQPGEIGTDDTCSLTFSFQVGDGTKVGNMYFAYTFASYEYNEWVNSEFNDVFGFFLDGKNIALIPGTTTPVSINNVNDGNPLGTGATNPQYYVNNDNAAEPNYSKLGYDGFTTVFTAQALGLAPGVHTIKLAISDVSDALLDSGVFLFAGTFSDQPPGAAGINVTGNASPTIVNNVITEYGSGISIDSTSTSTVYANNAYQKNTTNVSINGRSAALGTGDLALSDTEPLFVDGNGGNFYPAPGSRIIDASADMTNERPEMHTVRSVLGIPDSPILAPNFDLYGQLRADDPNVDWTGSGFNVFKDIGAIDRVDKFGPTSAIVDPADNGALDANLDPNDVEVDGSQLSKFSVQLYDINGVGIDDSTLNASGVASTDLPAFLADVIKVRMKDLSNLANQGQWVDLVVNDPKGYLYSYDPTNDRITLYPAQGVWQQNAIYEIELNPNSSGAIKDLAGNVLQPNRPDSTIRFQVANYGLDFGDAPDSNGKYPTLLVDNGASHVVKGLYYLGQGVTNEIDAWQIPNIDGGDALDDGITFDSVLVMGNMATVTATVYKDGLPVGSAAGYLSGWVDFTGNRDWKDFGTDSLGRDWSEHVLNSQAVKVGKNTMSFYVPSDGTGVVPHSTFARFRLSTASGLDVTGQAPDGEVEDYQVRMSQNLEDFGDAPDTYATTFAQNGARNGVAMTMVKAFDFGAATSPVAAGYAQVTEGTQYTAGGFGWQSTGGVTSADGLVGTVVNPDVTRDFNATKSNTFLVDLPANGWYLVSLSIGDPSTTAYHGTMNIDLGNGQVTDSITPALGQVITRSYWVNVTGSNSQLKVRLSNAGSGADAVAAIEGLVISQPKLSLGSLVDTEFDGQPSADATGDNTHPTGTPSDEDGVKLITTLLVGQAADIEVKVNSQYPAAVGGNYGTLNAWMDWNGNGKFDSGEQVIQDNKILAAFSPTLGDLAIPTINQGSTTLTLTIMVPALGQLGVHEGTLFTRVRLSAPGETGLGSAGVLPGNILPSGEVEDYQFSVLAKPLDFGDAPDGGTGVKYPTLSGNHGARAVYDPHFTLGTSIDYEPEALPNANATGDDAYPANAADDEDGVTFPSGSNIMYSGEDNLVTITVNNTDPGITQGYVNAWIDWNGNGSWNDGQGALDTEWVAQNATYSTGLSSKTLSIRVPWYAADKVSFMRVRLSENAMTATDSQGPDSSDAAVRGEVEDYQVRIVSPSVDFGDAPSPYPTKDLPTGATADSPTGRGARNLYDASPNTGYYLGQGVTADPDAKISLDGTATGDANDDGVTITTNRGSLAIGSDMTNSLQVTATHPGSGKAGYLSVWVDLNGDGDWSDTGEQVVGNNVDNDHDGKGDGVSLDNGANTVSFTIPSTVTPIGSVMRVRYSDLPNVSYDGAGTGANALLLPRGEVEDYNVQLAVANAGISGYAFDDTNADGTWDKNTTGAIPPITLAKPGQTVIVPKGDEGSSAAVDLTALGFTNGFNFYGTTYTKLYVNNNGNVTFGAPQVANTANKLGQQSLPMIAPFWADVDTTASGQVLMTSGNSLRNQPFVQIDWLDVGSYDAKSQALNSFTLYIENDAAGPIVSFIYHDMKWAAGDAKTGMGAAAQIGFDPGYKAGFVTLAQPTNSNVSTFFKSLPNQSYTCRFDLATGLPGQVNATASVSPVTTVAPGSQAILPTDEGSSSLIRLPFLFEFYGKQYNTMYVNNNGNVTFGAPQSTYLPVGTQQSVPMLAPFWSDVDTRVGAGQVDFLQSVNPATGHPFVQIDWVGVGYANQHRDLRNTYSLYIEDDPAGDVVAFSYVGLQWTTGDRDGGTSGLGGNGAWIGMDAGNGVNRLLVARPKTSDDLTQLLDIPDGQFDWRMDPNTGLPGIAEPGAAGVQVYLDYNGNQHWDDYNHNGICDPGDEPMTITAKDDPSTPNVNELGYYHFDKQFPGNYDVREIDPGSDWKQTTPPTFPAPEDGKYSVTLGLGQTISDVNFGNHKLAQVSLTGGSVAEGNAPNGIPDLTPAPVTVHLTGSFGAPVTVNYAPTADGSATVNEDYRPGSGSITIPAQAVAQGQWSSQTLSSNPVDSSNYNFASSGNATVWVKYVNKDWQVFANIHDPVYGDLTTPISLSSLDPARKSTDNREASICDAGDGRTYYVTWAGRAMTPTGPSKTYDVYMAIYDALNQTGQIIRLTDNASDDRSPQVSNQYVTWSGVDPATGRHAIYLFDRTKPNALTNPQGAIVNISAAFPAYDHVNPRIEGSAVVWSGTDISDSEVFAYVGGVDSAAHQLSRNTTPDIAPQVSFVAPKVLLGETTGHYNVVWQGTDSAGKYQQIYLSRLGVERDGSPLQLTTGNIDSIGPQISGDNLLWQRQSSASQSVIMYYDIAAGDPRDATRPAAQAISSGLYALQMNPRVSGDHAVWSLYDGYNWQIEYYEIGSGRMPQMLTSDSTYHTDAQIAGTTTPMVVWRANQVGNFSVVRAVPVEAEVTATLPILIVGDNNFEPDEDFYVNLTGATGATFDSAKVRVGITNDDSLGTITGSSARELYTIIVAGNSLEIDVKNMVTNHVDKYTTNATQPMNITIDGGGGGDSVEFDGDANTTSVSIWPDHAVFAGSMFTFNVSNAKDFVASSGRRPRGPRRTCTIRIAPTS